MQVISGARPMSRYVRLAVVVGLLAAVSAGAALVALWPFWTRSSAAVAPLPVPAGDHEVAWLNNATNGLDWERFVAAVRRARDGGECPELEVLQEDRAFPHETTAVPEFAVRVGAVGPRVWFRWYKLTGDTGTAEWVQALGRRAPAPLAVVGGGSSDRARDLADSLAELAKRSDPAPVLVITTATAVEVDRDREARALTDIYPGRTFRFCFTNAQMAEAVTDFVFQHADLRPDEEPVYCANWERDPYSEDLFECFHDVLSPERFGGLLVRSRTARVIARDWGGLVGNLFGNLVAAPMLDDWRAASEPFWSMHIPSSVGAPDRPNRWDADVAGRLMAEHGRHPGQRRPLLLLPAANWQPAHRFLRALVRAGPGEAGRFVVATGDAVNFNTIYRDRNVNWPIQDLPFTLVLFCHRNPVDPVAFRADTTGADPPPPEPTGRTSTGTQDLMLYKDIVESLVRAAFRDGRLVRDADELREGLGGSRLPDGRSRFDASGNPRAGGEHVLCLRPRLVAGGIAPSGRLEVWKRGAAPGGGSRWALTAAFDVEYEPRQEVPR